MRSGEATASPQPRAWNSAGNDPGSACLGKSSRSALFARIFADDTLRCPRRGARRLRAAQIIAPLVARRMGRRIGAPEIRSAPHAVAATAAVDVVPTPAGRETVSRDASYNCRRTAPARRRTFHSGAPLIHAARRASALLTCRSPGDSAPAESPRSTRGPHAEPAPDAPRPHRSRSLEIVSRSTPEGTARARAASGWHADVDGVCRRAMW